MRASSNIVAGVFCGAELENGTFHFDFYGEASRPDQDLEARLDRRGHFLGQRVALTTNEVNRSPRDAVPVQDPVGIGQEAPPDEAKSTAFE